MKLLKKGDNIFKGGEEQGKPLALTKLRSHGRNRSVE
jgi:hypothetical protein